jgi:hypothetical protein
MTHSSPTIETHIDLLLNSAHVYSQLARVKSDLLELCRQFPSLFLLSGPFGKFRQNFLFLESFSGVLKSQCQFIN